MRSAVQSLREFAAAAVIAAAFATAPAVAAPTLVETGAYGQWRFEVVSRITAGGAGRVACSVATGPVANPTVFLSFAAPDRARGGDLSGFVYAETGPPVGAAPIGASYRIEFAAGGVRAPGRVVVAASADGLTAQSEAYPTPGGARRLIVAMATARSLALERNRQVLRQIPLDGFAPALRAAATACGYATQSAG